MTKIKTTWALTRVLVHRQFTGGRKMGNRLILNHIINTLKN